VHGVAQFGWIGGRNLRMDVRLTAGNVERLLMYANEPVCSPYSSTRLQGPLRSRHQHCQLSDEPLLVSILVVRLRID